MNFCLYLAMNGVNVLVSRISKRVNYDIDTGTFKRQNFLSDKRFRKSWVTLKNTSDLFHLNLGIMDADANINLQTLSTINI